MFIDSVIIFIDSPSGDIRDFGVVSDTLAQCHTDEPLPLLPQEGGNSQDRFPSSSFTGSE
jgi:hypothetical protein